VRDAVGVAYHPGGGPGRNGREGDECAGREQAGGEQCETHQRLLYLGSIDTGDSRE
jgi:hypothetical protein